MIHAALLYDRYQTLGIQCSFMTLTEIWMHIGTMLVTQWDPPTCANTWEFMLFCFVPMSHADGKLRTCGRRTERAAGGLESDPKVLQK